MAGLPSILFLDAPSDAAAEPRMLADAFSDLNLDQIVEGVTTGHREYGLEPYYRHPLDSRDESFLATNEREGSHVSREMLHALIESGIHVVFVTHLYDLAHGMYAAAAPSTVFLRAPREADGRRTFRLEPGEPLPTSFGRDVYERVFGDDATGK